VKVMCIGRGFLSPELRLQWARNPPLREEGKSRSKNPPLHAEGKEQARQSLPALEAVATSS